MVPTLTHLAARTDLTMPSGEVLAATAYLYQPCTRRPYGVLGWPAMVMDFKVKEPALLQTLKPGQQTAFQVTESPAGEYVIVRIVPRDSSGKHGRH